MEEINIDKPEVVEATSTNTSNVDIKALNEKIQKEDFRNSLASAISSLPEREKLVLALYYDEELNLKEIGEVIGVSESRISQINSQAMLRLQSRLKDWKK